MATPIRSKAAPAPGVSFGDMGMYSAGGGVPEGDYVWKELNVQMYQAANAQGVTKGAARLGVMITLSPLAGGDDRQQFYSMGGKAHESFAPNPETGKGVVAVPGGPASSFNNSTNWAILLKSLYDSGLPVGIFTDDVSVLEGIHVHMANIPEPAERAGFQSQTGEAAPDRKPGTIAVVTEIKDDGKPWEGTGGVPEAAPQAQAAPARVGPKAAAPKAATVAAPAEDDGLEMAAVTAISSVLEKFPNGTGRLQLQTGTFKAINSTKGQETASSVINTYFKSDAKLNEILGPLGYKLEGSAIKAL